MTSKNAQRPARSRFWVLKISCKIGVLKQSESAMFGRLTHMTILSVFTCMMNIWNQSIQTFVTGLGPFLWWIVQVCSLTIEYRVVQVVPSIRISEHFESILVTIIQQISLLLLWSGGHRCMVWILCRVVVSSCLPTHNIVPRISLHDQPYHKTTMKYEDFEGMAVSLFPPRKFAIRTWFCNCPQYLCLFGIFVECIPSTHDPRKMLVLPSQLLY